MRRIISFLVLSITILCLNLITGAITNYFLNYRGLTSPLKFTVIGMVVLVAIFYPVFEFMEKKIAEFTRKTIYKGSNVFGKFLGMMLVFGLIFFVLFCIYANMWFKINILSLLWSKIA